jgi:sugar phosphate isomerase/epimerase
MRLGAPIFDPVAGPQSWVEAHLSKGYSAAYCPNLSSEAEALEYARAAQAAGLVIAEVGAWSNPLSPDPAERSRSMAICQQRLALADWAGARCCVNIAGSRGAKWDGPDPRDLSSETFDAVVKTTRAIIDAVRPTRTVYALETMPWMYPDSIESYERLVAAIDRPAFGVHFDPANLINCPERYFHNADYSREFIRRLGKHIRSVHLKDIRLGENMTVHLDEARPGLGGIDYRVLFRELERLNPEIPVMCEHLSSSGEYDLAVAHIRAIARETGVSLK